MKMFLILLLILIAVGLAWIRLAPSDPARWHVNPETAEDPGAGGMKLVPPEAPVFGMPPEALLAAFDAVAMAEPRVTRLAGSVAEGRITYVARSRVFGFPDYVTVAALPADGGSTLAAVSRLRFGQSDIGVNRARLDRWLAALAP